MNLTNLDFVQLTGNAFLDAMILQLLAVGIAFGLAEWLTRRVQS